MKKLFWAAAIFVAIPTIAFSQDWRNIVPLHSTRTEVEQELGPPKIVGGVSTYYFDNERVEVFYAKYPCSHPLNVGKWNVPIGTVISVNIVPKEKIRLADMHLDLSKFRKERIPFDFPYEYSHLVNDDEGLTLSFVSFGKDFVDSYSYGPKASDASLHCPNQSEDYAEQAKKDCFPMAFRVDCSSAEIRIGHPVECRFESLSTPREGWGLRWAVSAGASLSSETENIVKVVLIDSTKPQVTVSVKVVGRSVCSDKASSQLRVIKAK